MKDPSPRRSDNVDLKFIAAGLWVMLGAAYALIFIITQGSPVLTAIKRALISVVPAAILSVPAFMIAYTYLHRTALWKQVCGHFCLALVFAFLWYLGIQTGYGLDSGWLSNGLRPNRISVMALAWQLNQGVVLYAGIAAGGYAYAYRDKARDLTLELDALKAQARPAATDQGSVNRLLVRQGRSIIPVETVDIILISGAEDFVDIFTAKSSYTSSKSLSELESQLAGRGFERVHRSHIVRLGAILSVSRQGDGRLTLSLEGGHSVTTSRAGAKRFRQLTA